jgi:hypothetical protein
LIQAGEEDKPVFDQPTVLTPDAVQRVIFPLDELTAGTVDREGEETAIAILNGFQMGVWGRNPHGRGRPPIPRWKSKSCDLSRYIHCENARAVGTKTTVMQMNPSVMHGGHSAI